MIEIIVERDYDGFFENWVRSWIKDKKEFKHKKIIISARPWIPYAVDVKETPDKETVYIDFYSALRTGFGSLSAREIEEIINLL